MSRPVSSAAALCGLIAGAVVVIGVWLPEATGAAILAWPWFALIGSATTVTVALLAAAFSGGSESRR
jgi:hypothetical protein